MTYNVTVHYCMCYTTELLNSRILWSESDAQRVKISYKDNFDSHAGWKAH